MKNLLIPVFIFLTINYSNSQDFDFGKVSKAELQEKFHPIDSSASAAILFRNEEISFSFSENLGFIQQRMIHMRIKVYNKDGFNWANEKVSLYKGDPNLSEKIKGIKGYTYNIEGGKIKKDKLKGDAIFDESSNELYNIRSFIMPNVKEGSVLEYTYIIATQSPFIDDLNLQFSIPTNKLEVRVATPQYYNYNKILNPKASFLPKMRESTKDKRIARTTRKVSEIGSGSGTMLSSSYDTSNTDYKENIVSFSEENIPALRAESYADALNNYKAKLSMELAAILDENNIVRQSFSKTWEKVSKSIYENSDFGGQLNRTTFFKNDVEEVLKDIEGDIQKIFLIESLVKSKVKWNGVYGKYAQNGIRNAYKEGEGNVADINLLVTAILRSQGFNANPVLVSTRRNGIPLFPTREGFNYVICMVELGNNYMLIDSTEPFSSNNILPSRVLNWKGRVFANDGSSSWVNLLSNEPSVESTMLNATINEDLLAKGTVRQVKKSHVALNYRKKYTGVSSEDHVKGIEANKGDLVVSDLIFQNDKDIYQPIRLSYKYELSDGIDDIGGNLYFNPMFFLGVKENPFKLKERTYPIDFIVPFKDKYLINIALPDNYKVESLPEPLAMEFKGGESKFVYIAEKNGKYLQIKVELNIVNPIVQPADYNDFKIFFEKTIEKQAEQIVLSRIE
ncbi:DUF3857 domain-containing protein [Winogradskyella sp. A2]|uniref:DUF3857 domain-containing protein n=1 Tax=Winogradskyella sp. A2 TaxID=3366944 RepID=UPI00398C4B43